MPEEHDKVTATLNKRMEEKDRQNTEPIGYGILPLAFPTQGFLSKGLIRLWFVIESRIALCTL